MKIIEICFTRRQVLLSSGSLFAIVAMLNHHLCLESLGFLHS